MNTVIHIIEQPLDIGDNLYIDFEKYVNDKDPKFKVGDNVRI